MSPCSASCWSNARRSRSQRPGSTSYSRMIVSRMSATRAGALSSSQIRAATRSRPKYLLVWRLRMTISPARLEDTWSLAATTSELVMTAHWALADDTTPPGWLGMAHQAPGLVAEAGGTGGRAASGEAQRRGALQRDQRQAQLDTGCCV